MAASPHVPEIGGYDYEFMGNVPDNYECLECSFPMRDPVQIVGCGHRLCNICMESLLQRPSPLCPVDREPLSRDKIFPDSAHQREILDLTVKCPHSGCSWTGALHAVEEHQSGCLLKEVQCSNSGCTERLTKKDLKVHESFHCFWRKINCEHCQRSFVLHQQRNHLKVCQRFPVQCTKCGSRPIPREKLEVHIRDECPETEVHCEYRYLGCDAMFPRSNTSSHSRSQVERHFNLALHCYDAKQLQVQELVSLVKEQYQRIKQLETQVKEQSQPRERLETQVKEQSRQTERLVDQVEEESQQRE